jgi:kynurenine formamidase
MALLGSPTLKGAIEWLYVPGIETGEYEIFCAPLRLVGAEASPCRVFLRRG